MRFDLTWVWPLSWLWRIRKLEKEVADLQDRLCATDLRNARREISQWVRFSLGEDGAEMWWKTPNPMLRGAKPWEWMLDEQMVWKLHNLVERNDSRPVLMQRALEKIA